MKHKFLIPLLVGLVAGTAGCEGPAGPAGTNGVDGNNGADGMNGNDGTDGTDGTDGMDGMDGSGTEVAGTVASSLGAAGEGVPIALVSIDDQGREIASFGGTLTDAAGAFTLSVDNDVIATTRLAFFADVNGERLVGSLTGLSDVVVDPVSTGVLSAVLLITETPAGRSLPDYTPAEMLTLHTAAEAALTAANTDLADPDAVLSELITSIGGQVADLSEGMYMPGPFTLPTPADVAAPITLGSSGSPFLAGDGTNFDLQPDGEIDDGMSAGGQGDACDDCFQLRVDLTTFPNNGALMIEDDSEIAIGPNVMSGLNVTRKVYVDPNGPGVIRYTDIYENPTASPITIDIELSSNFGADGGGSVLGTSSGDTTIDAQDEWFYINDGLAVGDAIVAIWVGPNVSTHTGSTALHTLTWDQVMVPANDKVTVIYFGALFDDPPNMAAIEGFLNGLPGSSFPGMQDDDYQSNISFTPLANGLGGGAGAVGSFTDLTLTNVTANTTIMTQAGSDGSFTLPLLGATGDMLTLVGTDGTSDMLTHP